jgi:hypothetical protein
VIGLPDPAPIEKIEGPPREIRTGASEIVGFSADPVWLARPGLTTRYARGVQPHVSLHSLNVINKHGEKSYLTVG